MWEKMKNVEKELILLRFKDKEDLKQKINKLMDDYNWKIKEIADKDYYYNNFQDWEIVCSIYDYFDNLLYDLTIFYCKTRINENIIVEVSFEKQF